MFSYYLTVITFHQYPFIIIINIITDTNLIICSESYYQRNIVSLSLIKKLTRKKKVLLIAGMKHENIINNQKSFIIMKDVAAIYIKLL
jgi:fumarate reductase subunit C